MQVGGICIGKNFAFISYFFGVSCAIIATYYYLTYLGVYETPGSNELLIGMAIGQLGSLMSFCVAAILVHINKKLFSRKIYFMISAVAMLLWILVTAIS